MNELRTSVLYIRINLVQFYPPRNGIEQSLHTWLPYVRGIVLYSHHLINGSRRVELTDTFNIIDNQLEP